MRFCQRFCLQYPFCLLGVLFTLGSALASESDPYTYGKTPLRDSRVIINAKVNEIFGRVLSGANSALREYAAETKRTVPEVSDTEVEALFSKTYYVATFKQQINFVFSGLEVCVNMGMCGERIHLQPGESVYAESHYNFITEHYLSDIANICGVRMGSDKLTHFLQDAFLSYNYAMNNPRTDDGELEKLMWIAERGMSGGTYTEVVSPADIEADKAGLKFFRDFFAPNGFFARERISGMIVARRKIDICPYVNSNFDETIKQNIFVGARKAQLLAAIEEHKAKMPYRSMKDPRNEGDIVGEIFERSRLKPAEEKYTNHAIRVTLFTKWIGDNLRLSGAVRGKFNPSHRRQTTIPCL